jgi:hypothetical protein
MLVSFVRRDLSEILFTKEYPDVLPLLEMVYQKAIINVLFDDKTVRKL